MKEDNVRRFYLITETLTVNDIEVAQYDTLRYTNEKIVNETRLVENWQGLVNFAIDPDFKRMNLYIVKCNED